MRGAATLEEGALLRALEDLQDSNSPRYQAAAVVTEAALDGDLDSPFFKGWSAYERDVLPRFIKLGIAVRSCEVMEGLEPRLPSEGFKEEISFFMRLLSSGGDLDPSQLPAEAIWHDFVIPAAVRFGYSATTA